MTNSRNDHKILDAREELVESAIAYALPEAWLRLRSAEWTEEHRKLQKLVKSQNAGLYGKLSSRPANKAKKGRKLY